MIEWLKCLDARRRAVARPAGGAADAVLEVRCPLRRRHERGAGHQRPGRRLVHVPRPSRGAVPHPEGAGRSRRPRRSPSSSGRSRGSSAGRPTCRGRRGARAARARRPQAAAPGSGDRGAGACSTARGGSAAHLAAGHGRGRQQCRFLRRRTSSRRRSPTRSTTGRSTSGAAPSRS